MRTGNVVQPRDGSDEEDRVSDSDFNGMISAYSNFSPEFFFLILWFILKFQWNICAGSILFYFVFAWMN